MVFCRYLLKTSGFQKVTTFLRKVKNSDISITAEAALGDGAVKDQNITGAKSAITTVLSMAGFNVRVKIKILASLVSS